jgi:hypothetical protein
VVGVLWEDLLYVVGSIGDRDRHGDVRTYVGDDLEVAIAASKRARKEIRNHGNRLWVWREPAGESLGLLTADVAAPAAPHRFLRLRNEDDRTAFELRLDEEVDPIGFVVLRKPWPLRGLAVYIKSR